MKKIYLLLTFIVSSIGMMAQTIVYSETMGSPSANTNITSYTGWVTTTNPAATITYSGTGSIRSTSPSSGYTGASGSGNVFFSAAGGQTFIIQGINTSSYNSSELQLSFGWTTSTAANVITVETSIDSGTNWTPITIPANPNTAWALKTITGTIIPQSTNLWLRFTAPATGSGMRIDDVKISHISASCVLSLQTPITACDAVTSSLDTYTITIPFTGGGTATYNITPTSGTVGGDNPSSVASGNIIITGTTEGINNTISISGGSCNYSIPITASTCKAVNTLPLTESFEYTAGTNLNTTQKWSIFNSGSDNILIESGNLTYTGITPSGERAIFAGTGSESFTPFTNTTAGEIYARFLISVNDLTGITANASAYIALFNNDNIGGFSNARLWIRENGGQYQFGISPNSSSGSVIWSTNLYSVGATQYLLLGYNFTTNTLTLTENPTLPSTASPTVSLQMETAITNIGGFLLRQDTDTNTPSIRIDELYINTSLPDGITLSNDKFDNITGLKVYPNPAKQFLNITSASFAEKQVVLYDVLGKVALTGKVTNQPLNVASLPKGVYVAKITEEGKIATRKVVIE